jgi:hypothetical protein
MLLMLALSRDLGVGSNLFRISFTLLLAASVFAVSESRGVLFVGLAIGIPAIAVGWAADLADVRYLHTTNLLISTLMLGFTSGVIVRAVLSRRHVDADTVLGGICVYLLLAMIFMLLHGLAEHLSPGSYLAGGESIGDWEAKAGRDAFIADLFYFSAVTMTTLGYGDIAPVTRVARFLSIAEAMIGQLYVAIFVARLVALQVSHAQRVSDDSGR